jgi:hypothetical protein
MENLWLNSLNTPVVRDGRLVYVGEGSSSLCCKKPMKPVDDGQPLPTETLSLGDALKAAQEEEGDE